MKNFTILLTLILLMSFFKKINAAHIIGGEVNYFSISQGNYHITLKLYRDCNGGGAPFDSSVPGAATGQVTVYRGNDPTPFRSIILQAPEITPVDYQVEGCIANLPDLCVEQGVYSFNVSLPVYEESYYIVYQRCCRNITISNILAPGETGATYMAEITPAAQGLLNYGTQFNEFPPVLICANEPLVFDHSASDYEGDSLVYEFCAPLKGGDVDNLAPDPESPPPHDPVDFVSPMYSLAAPLAGNPTISIDPQTGIITGTPTIVGQFVVGVCVKEYRNSQLINTVQRDFQFNVTPCNFTVEAYLDGETNDGKHFLYESCGEYEIAMLNESYDEENIESYYWEFDLGGNIPLTANSQDLTIEFPASGTYRGMMILNGGQACADTAFIKVNIFDLPLVEIEYEYDPCEFGPVNFSMIMPTSESVISDWVWDFGNGASSGETDPLYTFPEEGTYDVSLAVRDENGCTGEAMLTLDYTLETLPSLESPPSLEGCTPLEASFDHLADALDETYQVIWDFGDGDQDTGLLVEHIYHFPGEYGLSLQIISPTGCENLLSYENTILAEAPPIADFEYMPGVINKMETIQFKDLSERAVSWKWDFGDGGISIERDPVYVYQQAENFEIRLDVEDRYGCRDSLLMPIEVRPFVNIFVPNAFSPNNDGYNDEFLAYPSCPLDDFQMKVFDRWGAQLFESNNIDDGWDGVYKKEAFDPGVFTWIVTYRLKDKVHMLSGDVTLLR